MTLNDIQELINKYQDLEELIEDNKENCKSAYKNYFNLALEHFSNGFNAIYEEIKYHANANEFRPYKITFIKSQYKKACESLGTAIPELKDKMEIEYFQMEKN